MYKYIWLFVAIFICSKSYASVDIDLACKEKEEQKKSLLTKMSTSYIEANLAGQCIGFETYNNIDIKLVCAEFIEQKKALLPMLSTSLKEANLAGMCLGAIYRIAIQCNDNVISIDYELIAKSAASVHSIKDSLGCYSEQYGW